MWGFAQAHAQALSDLTRDTRAAVAKPSGEDRAPASATYHPILAAHPWHRTQQEGRT